MIGHAMHGRRAEKGKGEGRRKRDGWSEGQVNEGGRDRMEDCMAERHSPSCTLSYHEKRKDKV